MTLEDLQQGMKMLFDQQVQFADELHRVQEVQATSAVQILDLTASQNTTMKALTTLVTMVGDNAAAQKHTDATVAALAGHLRTLAGDLGTLTRRVDAFIAALRNGHERGQ